jgi:hypothetical protein
VEGFCEKQSEKTWKVEASLHSVRKEEGVDFLYKKWRIKKKEGRLSRVGVKGAKELGSRRRPEKKNNQEGEVEVLGKYLRSCEKEKKGGRGGRIKFTKGEGAKELGSWSIEDLRVLFCFVRKKEVLFFWSEKGRGGRRGRRGKKNFASG